MDEPHGLGTLSIRVWPLPMRECPLLFSFFSHFFESLQLSESLLQQSNGGRLVVLPRHESVADSEYANSEQVELREAEVYGGEENPERGCKVQEGKGFVGYLRRVRMVEDASRTRATFQRHIKAGEQSKDAWRLAFGCELAENLR